MLSFTRSHFNSQSQHFFAPPGAIGWLGGDSTYREIFTEESIIFHYIGSNDIEPPELFLDFAKLHVVQRFQKELTGESSYNLVFLGF